MSSEIDEFVRSVGGVESNESNQDYACFGTVFKRRNYFRIKDSWCIVKISRTAKPFWGIGRKYIDLFAELDTFYIILLASGTEGWVFSKPEVFSFIRSGRWNLRDEDQNYKINPPLPDTNSFASPCSFLKIMASRSA